MSMRLRWSKKLEEELKHAKDLPTLIPVPAANLTMGPLRLSGRRCFLRLLHAILKSIVDELDEKLRCLLASHNNAQNLRRVRSGEGQSLT